jgi:hypothetical protein
LTQGEIYFSPHKTKAQPSLTCGIRIDVASIGPIDRAPIYNPSDLGIIDRIDIIDRKDAQRWMLVS